MPNEENMENQIELLLKKLLDKEELQLLSRIIENKGVLTNER